VRAAADRRGRAPRTDCCAARARRHTRPPAPAPTAVRVVQYYGTGVRLLNVADNIWCAASAAAAARARARARAAAALSCNPACRAALVAASTPAWARPAPSSFLAPGCGRAPPWRRCSCARTGSWCSGGWTSSRRLVCAMGSAAAWRASWPGA
jgi:hypothetical protein